MSFSNEFFSSLDNPDCVCFVDGNQRNLDQEQTNDPITRFSPLIKTVLFASNLGARKFVFEPQGFDVAVLRFQPGSDLTKIVASTNKPYMQAHWCHLNGVFFDEGVFVGDCGGEDDEEDEDDLSLFAAEEGDEGDDDEAVAGEGDDDDGGVAGDDEEDEAETAEIMNECMGFLERENNTLCEGDAVAESDEDAGESDEGDDVIDSRGEMDWGNPNHVEALRQVAGFFESKGYAGALNRLRDEAKSNQVVL